MQCDRCLLDDSFPGIKFNKNNICSECISFDIAWGRQLNDPEYLAKTKLKLENILKKAKNTEGKYDCAVITCGGIDSLYALYLIKTLYGLNPLVICIDNGFWNAQAKKNLDVVLNELKIESIYYRPRNLKNLYRHFLIHTGNICIVCVYIIQFHIARIALEYKIRLIITGLSKREDAVLPFGATPINFTKVMRLYIGIMIFQKSVSSRKYLLN